MNDLLSTDKYTKQNYDRDAGEMKREWIRYADNTFEPVRQVRNTNRKYHSKKRMTDWWVVQKPQDRDSEKTGHNVSLNHDYGEWDKSGGNEKGIDYPDP